MQVVFLAQTVTPLPAVVVPESDAGVVDAAHSLDADVHEDEGADPCIESLTHQEIVHRALFTLRLIEQNAARLNDAEDGGP
jgi:hypothetical protein